MNLFKSTFILTFIGLNPILCAVDEAFHCKVPINKATSHAGDQSVNTQQETKKTQAELDAAQFAKERESKRRSALQNALASNEKPDFQLCKTALLCKKKLPAPLQRYVCSYLDKQFYLDRSFKAHNDTFKQVITHTKAHGTWYILALTSDDIVAKIDGTTGEVLSVIDKIPNIYRIFIHSESENSWFINIITDNRRIFTYDGEECELTEEKYDLLPRVFDGCYCAEYEKGGKRYRASRWLPLEIKIHSLSPWKFERIISMPSQDLLEDLPMTLHIQPKGTVDLVVTHQDGQISIVSEGPETFEQCLTNNFIPSLELPVPLPMDLYLPSPLSMDKDHLRQRSDNNAPRKRNLSTLSQLKKMTIGGILAAGAVGAGIALMKYLKR